MPMKRVEKTHQYCAKASICGQIEGLNLGTCYEKKYRHPWAYA